MKFVCLAILVSVTAQPTHDVKIDWQKLTYFSTDVSLAASNLPVGGPYFDYKTLNLKGHIQLDLLGEKLKISVKGEGETAPITRPRGFMPPPSNPLAQALSHASGRGSSELVVDGPGGTISFRTQEADTIGPGAGDTSFCMRVRVPPKILPPAGKLQQELKDKVNGAKIEQELNMIPHTTEGGVVTYQTPPPPEWITQNHYPYTTGKAVIRTDGVPIEYESVQVCDLTCQERHHPGASMELNFSNWKESVGDMETFSCAYGSSTDLSAHPAVMHSAALLTIVAQKLSEHPDTEWLASKVPSLSPLYEEQLRLAAERGRTELAWSPWPVALTAGMAGGMLVLVLAKVFKHKSSRGEPLLSYA